MATTLRDLWRRLALTAGIAITPASLRAQQPLPPTGPVAGPCRDCGQRGGPLHRAARHLGFTLKDNLIGYPDQFVVPPLGTSVQETYAVMKAKADGHEFILYHSDFRDGTSLLAPGGADRLSQMARRLPRWLGPLVIEWTPDQPELAEARRVAVLTALGGAGLPIGPERVIVGPSPYEGMAGNEAANNHINEIRRGFLAPSSYSLPPTQTSTFGYGR